MKILRLSIALIVCHVLWFPIISAQEAEKDVNPDDVLTHDQLILNGPWNIPLPDDAGFKPSLAASLSYPDEKGFRHRSMILIHGLANVDLGKWRRGYFKGGDPGKSLPLHAMAKLILNPEDPEPLKYINDKRSYKEHYHFAAVNWSRYYPIFGEKTINDEIKKKFAQKAFSYSGYLNLHGTENHRTMSMTSASVLPYYINGGLSNRTKQETLKRGKEMLRYYVKSLYAAGQGEWDSSTYVMFDINGLLNIYDFTKDSETRLIAKAGLDWLLTAYAVKYTEGVYTAPNQRGFAPGPMRKIADWSGWLWWGATRQVTPDEVKGWRHAMHAATSGYRPNRIITNIARKQVELPYEQRNSKPNYYYGLELKPQASHYHETVYASKSYTLGTLWNGHGSQITRMQLVVKQDDGALVLTGGHPRKSDHNMVKTGIGFKDGNGRYDQAMQVDGTHITLTKIPDDEKDARFAFFTLPNEANQTQINDWIVFELGETYIAVRSLGNKAEVDQLPLSKKQKTTNDKAVAEGKAPRYKPRKIVKMLEANGVTGFILETAEAKDHGHDFSKFTKAIAMIEVENLTEDGLPAVRYTNLNGKVIEMAYKLGTNKARVVIDGKQIQYGNWPVYAGPYVNQRAGVLEVNDGIDGFIIDFTGDLPVYKKWIKPD